MKRILSITLFTAFAATGIFAQESQIPLETAPETIVDKTLRKEELLPPETVLLFGGMGVDIPVYRDTREYDREQLEVLRRKLFSEIPKYPAYRLWDNQYASPFLYSSRSNYTGLDMAGIGTRFQFTDWLSLDVATYLSGAYMGRDYPGRYMNATVSGTLRIKLHDRIYLVGMGEFSVREGINPKMAPGLGGKNSLGAGVEIFITEKFGFTIGHVWEYYRGNWYGNYRYGPIMHNGKQGRHDKISTRPHSKPATPGTRTF